MLVEAETRIWLRVRAAVSFAKSASRIEPRPPRCSRSDTLSERIVAPTVFFWKAPRRPRVEETTLTPHHNLLSLVQVTC